MKLVNKTCELLFGDDEFTIKSFTYDEYQGDIVFIIRKMYDRYYCVRVSYGSCSGCDALQAVNEGENKQQGYWNLALHIVQNMVELT